MCIHPLFTRLTWHSSRHSGLSCRICHRPRDGVMWKEPGKLFGVCRRARLCCKAPQRAQPKASLSTMSWCSSGESFPRDMAQPTLAKRGRWQGGSYARWIAQLRIISKPLGFSGHRRAETCRGFVRSVRKLASRHIGASCDLLPWLRWALARRMGWIRRSCAGRSSNGASTWRTLRSRTLPRRPRRRREQRQVPSPRAAQSVEGERRCRAVEKSYSCWARSPLFLLLIVAIMPSRTLDNEWQHRFGLSWRTTQSLERRMVCTCVVGGTTRAPGTFQTCSRECASFCPCQQETRLWSEASATVVSCYRPCGSAANSISRS